MLRLRDEARIVAAGDFGHEVAVDGPREIRELADDIEAMRLRITDELSEVVRARTELAEKAAALEQSNTDLEQFAYVASHDLQEPLRKVSNFCQLLERQYSDQLDDRALQYIGFAVDGARRMQALIQDLLAFSRVGRTTEGFEPVDLEAVAVEARATLENEIEEAGATVTIDPDLPTVEGDSGLLATLFQNLIGNAVKYRSEQPPAVSLTYEGVVEGMHRIAVADNGIGIDPAYADRIFVIFQRLHVRDAYSGTGIGLAICKKIVEYHSGRIWLDPEPTEGARFWLALPVGAVDEQDVQHDVAGASG
jgi:light-regulated signal transduction histidine kinase (bacteriophytochrome)